MEKILILNGPNLNLLGSREPDIYGFTTWAVIENRLSDLAKTLNLEVNFFQSNSEATLIDTIQELLKNPVDLIIFNPAGYTGTSIALRDALLAVQIPFYEVHISNIYAREIHHRNSVFSGIAKGVLVGFGEHVYAIALMAGRYYLDSRRVRSENEMTGISEII
jgi:3-dehydroquinate dehydratase-2